MGTAYRRPGDPAVPSLLAWALQDGEYVETGRVSGTETFKAESPFRAELPPAELLR